MRGDDGLRRRRFLHLAATAGAALLATACGSRGDGDAPDGGAIASDDAPTPGLDGDVGSTPGDAGPKSPKSGTRKAGFASFSTPSLRRAAVRRAVELAGGIGWLKSGDRVLIKVAHNSMNAYPATVSPESAGELARMFLDAGASRVVIADVMGIENTLVPGGWAMEDEFGRLGPWDMESDATIRAFRASGLYAGVEAAIGAGDVGPGKRVQLTSFREHNWRRVETAALMSDPASARLSARWVKEQVATNVDPDGKHEPRAYAPRVFDDATLLGEAPPGLFVPNLFDEVDHVVNLHRISTHITSMFTLALKNWVGTMRPDDRLWMHQLTFLLDDRATGSSPLRTEPPYNEMLAELHLPSWKRERLIFADATDVFVSGGPDDSPSPSYPANLMIASTDLVSAEVLALAVLRMGVLASVLDRGLGGKCDPIPRTAIETSQEFLMWRFGLRAHGLMRGTDEKLCDLTFPNWDWILVRRARELGLGATGPKDLDLSFAADPSHAVPDAHQKWIEADVARGPSA